MSHNYFKIFKFWPGNQAVNDSINFYGNGNVESNDERCSLKEKAQRGSAQYNVGGEEKSKKTGESRFFKHHNWRKSFSECHRNESHAFDLKKAKSPLFFSLLCANFAFFAAFFCLLIVSTRLTRFFIEVSFALFSSCFLTCQNLKLFSKCNSLQKLLKQEDPKFVICPFKK